MNETVFLSLISGLFGSIIGGLTTYLVTKYSLKETVKNSILLETQKNEADSKLLIKSAYNALIIETKENIESIDKWSEFRANFRFSREAWVVYKAVIPTFDSSVQESLIKTYSLVGRYNTVIDYDVHVPVGLGTLDKQKEDRIGEVKTSLLSLKDVLLDRIPQ